MNAVLEKPARKARAPKAKPAPTVPELKVSEDAALFMEVGNFLREAFGTDEDHAFSGESDRLLSIGAMIALDAAQGKFSNTNAENTAYDVAACVNAARLVPDDSESMERTLHIDNAGQRLATITRTHANRMLFTDVPRPTRAQKPAAEPTSAPAPASGGKQFTKEQLKELYWRAYVFMDCASSVLRHYAEHADDSAVFAMRDLLEVYLKEANRRFDEEEVGDLISGSLTDLSCDLSHILALIEPYATNTDDGVLHGVDHLLSSAKRIVDGDEGVLDA